jgi:hypothetical protein
MGKERIYGNPLLDAETRRKTPRGKTKKERTEAEGGELCWAFPSSALDGRCLAMSPVMFQTAGGADWRVFAQGAGWAMRLDDDLIWRDGRE